MLKARLWILGVILGVMAILPTLSYANLLLNPGFESGLANWTVSPPANINVYATGDAHAVQSGSLGAAILFSGGLEQSFAFPDDSTLFFSVNVRLYTNSLAGNSALAQVTLNLSGVADPVILGGPVDSLGWSFEKDESTGFWLSDWMLLQGSVDVSAFPGVSTASIGISLLPGDAGGAMTFMFADNVEAYHAPLPWAFSLLGSGLLGLLALRKIRLFRR